MERRIEQRLLNKNVITWQPCRSSTVRTPFHLQHTRIAIIVDRRNRTEKKNKNPLSQPATSRKTTHRHTHTWNHIVYVNEVCPVHCLLYLCFFFLLCIWCHALSHHTGAYFVVVPTHSISMPEHAWFAMCFACGYCGCVSLDWAIDVNLYRFSIPSVKYR